MGVTPDRAKLIARLEVEARGFQNAKGASIRDVRWGKVLRLFNAGTVLELWSRSASGRASDATYHGMPVRGIGKMLTPKRQAAWHSRIPSVRDRVGACRGRLPRPRA